MADSNQLGTVILKLLVDNKEFAEGLKNSLQLVAISSTQMKDLMEFKIKAPDFSALDLAVEANQKKISELTKAQGEQAAASEDEGRASDDAAKKRKKHTESTVDGVKSIGQFRSEQRLQNFVVRESSQALLGLTTAVGFLSLGNKDAEGTTKKVQTSLLAGVTAANGMEFALFGMGNAAKNMNGSLGVAIRSLSGMAGPISAVVGVGAGLIAFASESGRKMRELAERGVDAYVKKIAEAGGASTNFMEKVRASLQVQQDALVSFERIVKNAPLIGGTTSELNKPGDAMRQLAVAQQDVIAGTAARAQNVGAESKFHQDIIDKLSKEIEEQNVLYDGQKKAAQQWVEIGEGARKLRGEIFLINDAIENGNLSEDERRKEIDERIAKERELAELNKSSLQIKNDRLGILEQMKTLGRASTDELVAQIDSMLKLKLTEQERLGLLVRRQELLRAQRELESTPFGPAAPTEVTKGLEAEKQFNEQAGRIAVDVIKIKYAADKAEAERKFAEDVERIKQLGGEAKKTDEEIGAVIEKRRIATDNKLAEIERQRASDKIELEQLVRGGSLDAEIEAVNQKYDEAERRALELYTNEAEYTRAIAALRIAREREIERVQMASIQRVFGAAQSLVSNIVGIAAHLSPEAQKFVDELQRGIAVVQSILAIVQTIKALTSFFSFLGLQSGGTPGSPVSPFASMAQDGVMVPGVGDGDKIPILAEPGEGIINKKAVQALGGPRVIEKINRTFPRFAIGGTVGRMQQEIFSLATQVSQIEYPSIIASLARQQSGGFNKETMDALIDEVRMLRDDVKGVRTETRDLADRINIKLPREISFKADARELKRVIKLDDESSQ